MGPRPGEHGERLGAYEVVPLLLFHCLALLPVEAAAVLLSDRDEPLRVFTASAEETRFLELLELQNEGGPAQVAYATRQPVLVTDLPAMADRWPAFVEVAACQGIRSAFSFPLRVHERTIGVLSLFARETTALDAEQVRMAEVLATMSTIGILNHRSADEQDALTRQLQHALESRVIIEQAKGVLAAQQGVDLGTAFDQLRSAARAARRPLPELAAEVVAGRVPPSALRARASDRHRHPRRPG